VPSIARWVRKVSILGTPISLGVKELSGWVLHRIMMRVANSADHPIMGG
jgi:hypothetical protein